jgi:hypothetical protein
MHLVLLRLILALRNRDAKASTGTAALGGGEVKPIEASVNPDKGVLRAVTGGNLALERTVARGEQRHERA